MDGIPIVSSESMSDIRGNSISQIMDLWTTSETNSKSWWSSCNY